MMKLTFYCRECTRLGRYVSVRWANLTHFLNHMEHTHGLQPAESSER